MKASDNSACACVYRYVRTEDTNLASLPEDNETPNAMLRSLLLERDQQTKRASDLHVENLRLQVELERYRKLNYGPRADRLRSTCDLAQVLLDFAEELEHKSIHTDDDIPQQVQPEYELRRVKRPKDGALWPTSRISPSRPRSTS